MSTLQATEPRINRPSFKRRLHRLGFIMPAVIFVVVMMAFPVVYNGWLSLHEWTGSARRAPVYVGFENYTELFTESDRFFPAVQRTFLFSTVVVVVELVLGIGIALLLRDAFGAYDHQNADPVTDGRHAGRGQYGLAADAGTDDRRLNKILRDLGLPIQPFLGSPDQALWVLMAVDIWQWTPMMAMITLAGLLSCRKTLTRRRWSTARRRCKASSISPCRCSSRRC